MTTFFKKAMLYLGLGSDEDFLGMDPQGPSHGAIRERKSTPNVLHKRDLITQVA